MPVDEELFEKRDFYLKTIMELEYKLLVDEDEKDEVKKMRKTVLDELDKVNQEIGKAMKAD